MLRIFCLSLGTLTGLACGGDDLVLPTDAGAPASITVVRGDEQSGTPGVPLADSIIVKVTDSAGNPVPGQLVVFTVASSAPGAAVSPQSSTTGATGMAGARWILGQAPGTQEVVAQVVSDEAPSSLQVRFTASAASPPQGADRLTLRTQPSSTATVDVAFERQPVVQIRDPEGDEIERSGVPVTAAIASGSGSLSGTTTRLTDESGRVVFTDLGITGATGPHLLIFAADGYTSVTAEAVDVRPGEAPPSPNQPPVAADDEYSKIEGFDRTLTVGAAAGVLQNDRDPEGGPLTARNASDPPNGRVTLNSDGSFSYDSDPEFFGDDRFTYRVEDGSGRSSTATVTIHVTPLNDRPRFRGGPDQTVRADWGPQRREGWAKSINPGADNESHQVLTFEVRNDNPGLFTGGGQPEVTREGPQSTRGTLTYTPSGRTGTTNVTVVLRDNGGDNRETSDPYTFTIRIRP